MSRHKTRKQRQALQEKSGNAALLIDNSHTLSWSDNKKTVSVKSSKKDVDSLPQEQNLDHFFNYDRRLITKDLIRTLVSSVVVFGVLVALYYQL